VIRLDPNRANSMRILLVTMFYLPDGGPAAPLFTLLCEELACRGHDVTVTTAVPHYPTGKVPPEFSRGWIQRSREQGVKVVRVRVPSMQRSRLSQRMIQFLSYQFGVGLAGLFEEYDVALFAGPALTVFLPFTVLSVLRSKAAVFSVHDVYPDVGVTLGIFRSKAAIAAVASLERFCLRRSKVVRILSESFIPPLRSLGVPPEKMTLIYDWVDTDLVRPLPRKNRFSKEHGLNDRFTVLYAGNIGFSQGLEQVLLTAQLLQEQKDIEFVIVGDGSGRECLMEQAAELNLTNIQFLPFQPRSRLPEVLATADISLVTLQKGMGKASLPSKSFSILASGRPLVASVDENSDSARLVERSGAGICISPEDPAALARAIMELYKDPQWRKQLGQNGREYALKYHSPPAAAERFERLLQAAMKSRE
jgi:putative colanic acid biosynthesis glycosyltransferase WcaI